MHTHTALRQHRPGTPAPQSLDTACAKIAETSLVLQLLGAGWRVMGQLVAVESLAFVLLRPKRLEELHDMLARSVCSLSSRLHTLGLVGSPLSLGESSSSYCGTGVAGRHGRSALARSSMATQGKRPQPASAAARPCHLPRHPRPLHSRMCRRPAGVSAAEAAPRCG